MISTCANVAKLRGLERADRSSATATSFQPEEAPAAARPILPAAPKAQPKRNPTASCSGSARCSGQRERQEATQ
jgi:hypothetical protein